MAAQFDSIDAYIATFPDEVREVLEQTRRTMLDVAPDADQAIAYQIPTLRLGGRNLVHFAAWKKHLSVYPAPDGDDELSRDLLPYAGDKGTLRFAYEQPIPYDLIRRVVAQLRQRHAPTGS